MPSVIIRAVRWVDREPFPGLVECRLLDADGAEHVLVDKCAVFDDGDRLGPDSTYPMELAIECRVLMDSGTAITIELAHDIEATDGQRTFRVARSSLV